MKLLYYDKWSLIRKTSQRETPTPNRELLLVMSLISAFGFVIYVDLLFGATETIVYHIARYTCIAAALAALYILVKDIVSEWKNEDCINIFSVLYAIGYLLGIGFVLFGQYFIES